MTRPHDMGGRSGDGPVVPTADGPAPYDAPWHRMALGLTLAAGGLGAWTIDESRAARERLPDYARLSYYEKWLAALADLLVAKGLVSRDELAAGADAGAPAPLSPRALTAERVAGVLARGTPYARPGPVPALAAGDRVVTRHPAANAFVAGGHTRLPAYAAGRCGQVLLVHGAHVLPDCNAHGLGEAAEPLYTVRFRAGDLWDDAASPDDEVTLDLWESYLERA